MFRAHLSMYHVCQFVLVNSTEVKLVLNRFLEYTLSVEVH